MTFVDFLYSAPIWQMGCVVGGIAVGSTAAVTLLIGMVWAQERRRLHNDIAGFLIAVVGIVYAILISSLAITVLARKDRAQSIVFEEADRVAALVREVENLAPDQRQAVWLDLAGYLDAVIDGEWPQMHRAERPTAAEASLRAVWRAGAALPVTDLAQLVVVKDFRGHIDALYEVRRARSALATTGVDPVVWTVVLLGSISTVLFAAMFGVENVTAHLLMSCLLAFSIALAMIMIIALDWPFYGKDSVSSAPLAAVRASLAAR